MADYDKGDLIRCTGTFTDADDVAINHANVFFKVRDPYRNVAVDYEYGFDAELVRSATGIYYADVSGTTVGRWFYRFYSTGTGQAAGENDFDVVKSEF